MKIFFAILLVFSYIRAFAKGNSVSNLQVVFKLEWSLALYTFS